MEKKEETKKKFKNTLPFPEVEEKKKKKKYRVVFWFVCLWQWLKRIFTRAISVYHRRGSHIITGYPGIGKTLLMSKLINDVDATKYFFITNINEFYAENVIHYNVFGLFYDGKQIKRLPTRDYKGRKLYGLILDEINLKFNRRLNRNRDYNNSFVGLIELIITHRHQQIPRIYFIGQKLELQDGQLQSLFKYWHNIIYKKERPIWEYYRDNKGYIIAPKKLFIENYVKSYQDEYLQSEQLDQVKIKYKDLTTYNTLGLAETYQDLPILASEKKEKLGAI